MALFKILKGQKANLPIVYNEGYCYVTTDEKKMYVDLSDSAGGRICLNAAQADSLSCGDIGSATQPVYFVDGLPVKTTYTLAKSVPSNAVFTDTNTKVTSVGNHYTPSADSTATLSADAANGSAATWNSTQLVTGVNLQRDAKGHITGVTVDSVKMPTNPNTNTAHAHTAGTGLSVSGSGGTSGTTTYSLLAAGDTLGGVKTGGDVTISSGVITVKDDSHNHTIANVDGLTDALENAANKHTGIFYIEGTSTAAGTWTGEHSDITEYYNGLTIAYKLNMAGASTTTLNINEYGAVTVKLNNTTALTTHYPAGSVLILVYTTDTASDGTTTAYWKISNYDSNTKVTQISTTTNASYHLLLANSTNIATSTAATVRKNASLYYNPASKILVSPKFSGALTGNASTATAFSAAKNVQLTGDVTGTSSSTGGWTIATTLASTGVAAGSYGLSSNTSPAFGASFSIPYVTVDAKGRVTSATTHTITLPANPNVDTKVTNTLSSTAKAYITGTTTSTTSTGTQVFNPAIYYSSSVFVAPTFSGALSGKATSAGTADSATKATKDASGNTITSTYETKTDATAKLTEAKNYTDTKVAGLVDSAPDALNTLNELAAALGDDANFATTVTNQIGAKANNTITISAGNGLTGGGNLTSNRTISANLLSTAKLANAASTAAETAGRVYPVAMDVNGKLAVNVPWTNTTYGTVTSTANGLMTSAMFTKLSGIAAGAEVNQNAFSNVKIGSTTIAADGKTDTLELTGSNVTLTPDATNDKVTIGITKANVTAALGYTPPTTNTTYSAGTGLSLSGTTFNHKNSISARTTATQSNSSPGYGGTFKVTEPLYDAQGHITGVSQATITFPAAQTIPTLGGGSAAANDATVVGGVTVSGHTVTVPKKTLSAGSNVTITGGSTTITISAKDTTYGIATSSVAGLVKSGTDITVDSNGNISVNDNSHNHTIANVTNLQTSLDNKVSKTGDTMSGNLTIQNSNPYVKFIDTANSNQVYYIQGYQGKFAFGPTFANAVQTDASGNMTVPSNATITPRTTNTGTLGTSSYKWNAVYATTFNGNATTATNATAADKLNSVTLGGNSETVDLNTLYESGKYKVYNLSSNGTYTNAPSDLGTRTAVCVYPISNTSFAQEIISNNGKKYIRYSDGTSTWSDWKVLISSTMGTAIGNSTNKAIYIDESGNPTPFTITPANIGAAPTSHASSATTYGKGTSSAYGHVKLSDSISSSSAASSGGIAATPKAVKAVYNAAAKLATANTFTADNTFDTSTTTTLNSIIKLGANSYGSEVPTTNNSQGRLFFVEDNTTDIVGLPTGGEQNYVLVKANSDTDDAHGTWVPLDINPQYNSEGTRSYLLGKDVEATSPTVINYETSIYSMGGCLYANKVYGAVWNDYAEYRNQETIIEPGYCVASRDNGQVYKTTEKFQACDGIVSDTFGFGIGENNNCKTPLAVAGRVLAYCEGNREDYHAGDTVCAGPEGKVCKMTREEIREWPDRIIGIVSEIPNYEEWGSENVKVNNRIWIKVK